MPNDIVSAAATRLPSRRSLVISLAGAGCAAVLPVNASQAQPDSQLIRLGADFDRLHAEFVRIRNDLAPVHKAFDAEIESFKRRGEWPFDDMLQLRRDRGVEDAIKQENAALDQVDAVTELIRNIPAQTISGMAVKLKGLAYECGFTDAFNLPDREFEWPEACFLELIREAEGHTTVV